MKKYKRVAAYVNLDAIEENFEAMKANLQAGTQIAAVVKANGYGHGAVPIAQMIEEKDYLWGFAAATIEEAVELRKNGIRKPILILATYFRRITRNWCAWISVPPCSGWTWHRSFLQRPCVREKM